MTGRQQFTYGPVDYMQVQDTGNIDMVTRLKRLHRITRRMMNVKSHDDLFSIVTSTASGLFGFEYNTVRRHNTTDEVLEPVATSPQLATDVGDRRTYERGETIQWDAVDSKEILTFEDVTDIDDDVDRGGSGTMIVVPLNGYGVLSMGSSVSKSLSDEKVELARVFGANIETAIDRLEHIDTLQKRETQLKSKNERLDAFAAKLSHELRNPLTVIAGRIELAQMSGDKSHLDDLDQEVNRMERLIDDILMLTRAGDIDVDPERLELRVVATDSWQAIRAPEATLEVAETTEIVADEYLLRQILENLFRNSVEHVGQTVTVTIGALEDGFYVEDDGDGLENEAQALLTDMNKVDGTPWRGLGLEIILEIADHHGWSVDVIDGSDGGARFEFHDVIPS